jgi:hypothetical protein
MEHEIPPISDNIIALQNVLEHAREMANHSDEIRMRNFNFFILLMAALFTGFDKSNAASWKYAISLTSLIFWGLDIRGGELLKYNREKIEITEPLLWKAAGLTGWKPIPSFTGIKFISHKYLYRTMFIGFGVAWIAILLLPFFNR